MPEMIIDRLVQKLRRHVVRIILLIAVVLSMQHLKTMLLTVESIEKLKYVTVADVQTVQK